MESRHGVCGSCLWFGAFTGGLSMDLLWIKEDCCIPSYVTRWQWRKCFSYTVISAAHFRLLYNFTYSCPREEEWLSWWWEPLALGLGCVMSTPVWKRMTSQSLALTHPVNNGPIIFLPYVLAETTYLRGLQLCTCKLWGKLPWVLVLALSFSPSLLLHMHCSGGVWCCPSYYPHSSRSPAPLSLEGHVAFVQI